MKWLESVATRALPAIGRALIRVTATKAAAAIMLVLVGGLVLLGVLEPEAACRLFESSWNSP